MNAVVDTVGINTSLLTDVISGNVPSRTRWRSSTKPKCNVQRTPLPEIRKFQQNNESQVKSLRMPGVITLSNYSRIYNSGDGQLPSGLAAMPGYQVEPHRARCAPETGLLSSLIGSRNSVTYVHRHKLRSRSLPHGAKQPEQMYRKAVTSDLYPSESFPSKYVYSQYSKRPPPKPETPEPIENQETEFLYESDSFDTLSDDKPKYGRTERPLTPEKVVHARKNISRSTSQEQEFVISAREDTRDKKVRQEFQQQPIVTSISVETTPRLTSSRADYRKEYDNNSRTISENGFIRSPKTERKVISTSMTSPNSGVSEYRHHLESKEHTLSYYSDASEYSDDTNFTYDVENSMTKR